MRSGYDNYDGIWGNEYYDEEFADIRDRAFTHHTFVSGDALVSIQPIPPEDMPKGRPFRYFQDGTVEVLYEGQPFDPARFELVRDRWTHEHCRVCQYSIGDGETFWVNTRGNILCDACHDHYLPKSSSRYPRSGKSGPD